jgi:vacuolar-type H+-ATPase subunit E/Vma4
MRRDADFFEDRELDLIYIAKKLKDALRLESVLTEAGIDYAVEPDQYVGGVIFRSERVGAFFYTAPESAERVREAMHRNGFRIHQ